MSYTPKHFTRRQQIIFENNKDFIKLGLVAVMLIAILALGISSCAAKRRAAAESAAESVQQTVQDNSGRKKLNVTSYPRLINDKYLLDADYEPPQLTRLYGMPDGVDVQLNFDAATAFTKLYDAMLADGLAIFPLSGYRTYAEQEAIFNYNLELHISEGMTVEEAEAYTLMFVAVPGSSEHQYGRSIDVTIDGTTNHDFHNTDQGKWLIDNAHKFGFVLRYPDDKVDITGIAYEPWHLRYVGLDVAKYMYENKLCLEEYVEYVRQDCPFAISEQ